MATPSTRMEAAAAASDDTFFHGRPVTRFGLITGGIVSFLDLFRHPERPSRPNLALTMAKLVGWIVGAVILASASAVVVGLLAVRTYERAFG